MKYQQRPLYEETHEERRKRIRRQFGLTDFQMKKALGDQPSDKYINPARSRPSSVRYDSGSSKRTGSQGDSFSSQEN